MPTAARSVAIVTGLLAVVTSASGQVPLTPTAVDSGKMVRMYTSTSRITGRLTARFQSTDTVLHYCRYPGPPCLGIEDSSARRALSTATLLRLEVSRGSQWRRGAIIGGVLGAATGAVATSFLLGFRECIRCSPKTPIVVAGAISSGLFWGGLGALWGSAFPKWDARR